MPKFMKTPEWEKYEGDEFSFELKEGAPEWLKIAVAKYFEPNKEKLIKQRAIMEKVQRESNE
jgi:hypothetical protein